MGTSAADATLAGDIVTAAGRLADRMRAEGLRAERKTSPTDLVSAADRAAEELAVRRIRVERPGDGIVGEEGTRADASSGRTWFVDPVDGTFDFLAGLPYWCSALALADGAARLNEQPVTPLLGAVFHPATGELWVGGEGTPTTCNGRSVAERRASQDDRPLAELSLATYLHPPRLAEPATRDAWLRALAAVGTVRTLGSGSVELAAVAGGRLGAWLHIDAPPWDWLPGAALVHGAGGTTAVFDAHGHRWHLAGGARAVAGLTDALRG